MLNITFSMKNSKRPGNSNNNIYQIDRGYEKIEERLKMLGAKIERQE